MRIGVVGLNHDTASAEIREKVTFSESRKIEAISNLLDRGIKEVIILSTCSRSEIYFADISNKIEESSGIVVEFLVEFFDVVGYEEFFYTLYDRWAIEHIFKVATGLNSIVLCEDQILGQVKNSQEFSMENGGSKKILNKLFREAATTAKKIKSTLKISEHPLSLSYIGVKHIIGKLGDIRDKNVAILGYGKMGQLALKNILVENPNKVVLINRSYHKVENILNECPGVVYSSFDRRYEILRDADIIISSTAASHLVIKDEEYLSSKGEVIMLDLSMPRDIDSKIGEREGVNLLNIDDLKETSLENEKKRHELALKAKDIIDVDVSEYITWVKSSKSDDVIRNMNILVDEIKEDTMNFFNRKLDMNCSENAIIEKMLLSSLKRMIREPILKLKEETNDSSLDEYIKVLNKLYGFKEA